MRYRLETKASGVLTVQNPFITTAPTAVVGEQST